MTIWEEERFFSKRLNSDLDGRETDFCISENEWENSFCIAEKGLDIWRSGRGSKTSFFEKPGMTKLIDTIIAVIPPETAYPISLLVGSGYDRVFSKNFKNFNIIFKLHERFDLRNH